MSQRPLREAELTITEISSQGTGMGKIDDRIVEVTHTCPGDKVRVQLARQRRGKTQGRLLELIEPSKDRIQPRCAHFGECGGCAWQHLPYEKQLAVKQGWIERLFQGMFSGSPVQPILACDPPWNYRNKMEFSFSQNKAGDRFLGLMLSNGRGRVFNLTECHLPNPWMAETLDIIRNWWVESGLTAYHPPSDTGSLRCVTMREGMTTGERMVVLLVSGNPEYALKRSHLDSLTAVIPEPYRLFVRIQQCMKGQQTQFFEMELRGPDHIREIMHVGGRPFEFWVSPAAFFQPNTRQAERLYARALEMVQIPEGGRVCDLYCGTGTLGMFAATKAREVIGIELSPESSLDARENAKRNGIENYVVHTGDVGKVLAELQLSAVDLVMVDPPRAGLDLPALQHLVALSAHKILYISCNPATQAENVKELVAAGYAIEAIQPVDQFPHTRHVENIVVLVRAP